MTTKELATGRAELLVETDWLERHLGDPDLRIFDCTVELTPNPDAVPGKEPPYRIESGRPHYDVEHIPGAGFIDVLGELSDASSKFPFMNPPAVQFVAAMNRHGVEDGRRVVLYSASMRMPEMWATRVWWMLRYHGFDQAVLLNGGWAKWKAEGRPVSTAACAYPAGHFVARTRPALFVGRDEVKTAIGHADVCTINALLPEQHAGTGGGVYGRRGRIAGSVNVPAASLRNAADGTYRPVAELREKFAAVGADRAEQIIVYCGGGISATSDAFALTLLGYDNVAVYDASMYEWSNDPSLPMETG